MNYQYVIDSSFRPFSMEEMITPFAMYKDAYEKTEASYEDLVDKSDRFKYLSETLPEDSKARSIYEGYANDLSIQAQDLAKHGLTMNNRRALTGLKRRYQGEIGQLEKANTALEKERELRRQMSTKDSSILYAQDNISIDDFLGNKTPNLYNVSGEDLYKRGAQTAASTSSRIYSDTNVSNLTNYYQELVQTVGYSPELMTEFRNRLEAIPEFNAAVEDILKEKGVNTNLTGINYERARQSVINGIIDGTIYKESRAQKENPGVLTAAQAASNALSWANHNLNVANHDLVNVGGKYVSQDEWMFDHDPITGQRIGYSDVYKEAVKAGLVPGKNVKMDNGTGTSGSNNTKPTKVPLKKAQQYDKDGNVSAVSTGANNTFFGKPATFDDAVAVNPAVAGHDPGMEKYYDYYINGTNVIIIPRGTTGEEIEENNTVTTPGAGNQL